MLYIFTQVMLKWPQKTRQMEYSATLPQPALPQPEISQNMSWTDAYSLTLEQICKDLGIFQTELDPCMLHHPAQFQAGVLQTPESQTRKAVACLKKTRIKSTKTGVKPILEGINSQRLPIGRYQKLQPPALTEMRQSECPTPTTSSTAVAATWTRAPDETFTTPTISCISTTPSSSDLATLIYTALILDNLKSISNLEINLHKNLFCKFFYPQLISFLNNALSAQLHSYKSLDSVISSALRFLRFK